MQKNSDKGFHKTNSGPPSCYAYFFAQRLILKWATWNSPLGNHDYRVKNPFDIELILGFGNNAKGMFAMSAVPRGPFG